MIRVLRVLAPNPGPFTLEGTNTWVVGGAPSAVIDPGPDDAGHILAVLDEAQPVGAILVTHRHPDHAPGAARLAGASGAPVYAYRPQPGELAVGAGHVIEVGSLRIRAIHTPGHTADHMCFLVEPDGLLFTGDTVLGRGTSVIDPPEGDMAAYIRSLRRLGELDLTAIYPGHGPVMFTPKGRISYYVEHRLEREAEILRALEAGPRTPAELVPGLYAGEVPEELYPAAARSVLAHLLKLERERRVVRTGRYRDERFTLVRVKPCSRCGRPAAPGSRLCERCAFSALQESPAEG